MADSNSFSSFMALVDNHLSKTSSQASSTINNQNSDNRANETLSETRLNLSAGQSLPLPTTSRIDSPIQEVLARQVHNMLKAQDEKKQKEILQASLEQQVADDMEKLKIEDKEHVIDLEQAVYESMNMDEPLPVPEEPISSSSSMESLIKVDITDLDKRISESSSVPRVPDVAYIIKKKVKHGQCSHFGKVSTGRLKPVVAPYVIEKVQTFTARNEFKTKSPCDLSKENLKEATNTPCYHRKFKLTDVFPVLEEIEKD